MLKKLNIISAVKDNIAIILLVAVGSVSLALTMVKSGLVYDFGMGFWGANGHDGVWHIALIESIARGGWQIPIFAGHALKNYHIGFDMLVVILHNITRVSVVTLYFQVVPILLALGIGISCWRFVFAWKSSRSSAFWAVFFVYFGGGWGWLVTLIRNGVIGGESMFWSQQSISTLVNPPYALSIVMIFVGLELIARTQKSPDWLSTLLAKLKSWFTKTSPQTEVSSTRELFIATVLFGSLIYVKVYAGLLLLAGLFVASCYELLIVRQGIRFTKVFIGSLILSLLLFLPTLSTGGSVITWKPFWFLETMMQISDRLNWVQFGEAMINYKSGGFWWKALPAYTIAFFIFWYGNVGSRILGEIYLAKRFVKKQVDSIDVILISVIILGILIPTFFVQSGTPWNTIQFLYYSLLFSGVLAGIAFGQWIDGAISRTSKAFFILVILVLTLPTSVSTLWYNYIPGRPPAKISKAELRALDYLATRPEGIVLTYPYDEMAARAAIDNPPRPLSLYESTAYVAAFGKHDVFLEDQVNLTITGYDWPSRRGEVEEFLEESDESSAREFLKKHNIRYVYWLTGQRAVLGESQLGLEKLFENEEVTLYEVVNEQ